MRSRLSLWAAIVFFALNSSYADSTAPQKETKSLFKRFALIVGANDGGPQRIELKYAVSDAESMKKLFEDMGGINPGESRILADPRRKTLLAEMDNLREQIKECKSTCGRTEIIFYYSGHSDESHLLLGGEKVSYKELREAVDRIDSDVRIVILDCCASGSFVRLKGGQQKLPFLMDTAFNMKGYAVMTSSSLLEASQESDLIKGSFFSHYLISGMRGAADVIRDGKVTLSEAYQFAFNETLAGTVKTVGGPQHPSYNIQMSGTGDVVMTEINQSSAVLIMNKELSGRLFIYNKDETLVAELSKALGEDMELGVEPGRYQIMNLRDNRAYEAAVTLKSGDRVPLDLIEFTKTGKIHAAVRGDIPLPQSKKFWDRISLKMGGGLGNALGGDINTWIDDQKKYSEGYSGAQVSREEGHWHKINSGLELKGECLLRFGKNFSVGIGSGCFWMGEMSKIVLINTPYVDRIASNIRIKTVPIEMNAYLFHRLGPQMNIYIKGGVGCYFGTIHYAFRNSRETNGSEIWHKSTGKARGSRLGVQAGLGWDVRLSRLMALFVEAQGRYCVIKRWEGKETVANFEGHSQTTPGTMQFYTAGFESDIIPLPRRLILPDPFVPCVDGASIRRFKIDLSGASLNAGIRIAF